jgi:DNA-binding MarR family transcriptional regulator
MKTSVRARPRRREGRRLRPRTVVGYLLARAAHAVGREWEEALRSHNINPRQFSVLSLLDDDPGLSSAQLARLVLVTPQSMSESLAALLEAGLVVRRTEPSPGRSIALDLSPAGRRLLELAYPLVSTVEAESFRVLTDREKAQLGSLLRKLLGE